MCREILARFQVVQCSSFKAKPDAVPVVDLTGAEYEFGDEAIELVDTDDVLGWRRRKLDGAGKDDEIGDRNAGNDVAYCTSASVRFPLSIRPGQRAMSAVCRPVSQLVHLHPGN